MLERVLRFGVVSILLTATAWAGPLEDAEVAYKRGDYETALRLFKPLAERGDAEAQSNLGGMYFSGEGVPQDYAKAAYWFQLSAEKDNSFAQVMLGGLYKLGLGVTRDPARAVRLFHRAAEKGFSHGQYHLGGMYEEGIGVPKDYVLAYKWYNIASSRVGGDFGTFFGEVRDKLAAEMTSEQIAEAQRLTREWRPKSMP